MIEINGRGEKHLLEHSDFGARASVGDAVVAAATPSTQPTESILSFEFIKTIIWI